MLYFSSMSGLVARCTAAICLELFKSVNTHVEHVTHNEQLGLPPDCRRRWIQKRLLEVLQHMFEVLSAFPSLHFALLLHCIHLTAINRLEFYKNMRYEVFFLDTVNFSPSPENLQSLHTEPTSTGPALGRGLLNVGWDGLLKVGMFRMT